MPTLKKTTKCIVFFMLLTLICFSVSIITWVALTNLYSVNASRKLAIIGLCEIEAERKITNKVDINYVVFTNEYWDGIAVSMEASANGDKYFIACHYKDGQTNADFRKVN